MGVSGDGPYRARGYLLSRAELRFFLALRRAVAGSVHVAAKVRLADVVACREQADTTADRASLSRISQKHLDFVLIERKTARILGAVELDDRSHLSDATVTRDRFVNEVLEQTGVPLVRVQAAAAYNPHVLAHQLRLIGVRPRRTVSGSDRLNGGISPAGRHRRPRQRPGPRRPRIGSGRGGRLPTGR